MIAGDEVLKLMREVGALLLQYPDIADRLTSSLAEHLADAGVETVISPAVGGIVVGQGVARALGARAIFAEREGERMTLPRPLIRALSARASTGTLKTRCSDGL